MQNINRERGRLWVQALLSDEYRQANGAFVKAIYPNLPDATPVMAHCCLAVATDVAVKNGCEDVRWHEDGAPEPTVQVRWDPSTHDFYENYDYVMDDDGTVWINYDDGDLPPPVVEWYGIVDETRSRAYNPTLDGVRAIQRNDDSGDDFATIARAIEVEIERVGS